MSKTYLQEKIEFTGLSSGTNYYITFDDSNNLVATDSVPGVKRQLVVTVSFPDNLVVKKGGSTVIPRYNIYKEQSSVSTYICVYELDSSGTYTCYLSGTASGSVTFSAAEYSQKSLTVT